MAGYRAPFTLEEDKRIIKYIKNRNYIDALKGDNLWKNMAKDNICCDRTWQSLKNRWKKKIFVDLGKPEYELTEEERSLFKIAMRSHSKRSINSNLRKCLVAGGREESNEDEQVPDGVDEHSSCKTSADGKQVSNERSEWKFNGRSKQNSDRTNRQNARGGEDTDDSNDNRESLNELQNIKNQKDRDFYSLDMSWSNEDTE